MCCSILRSPVVRKHDLTYLSFGAGVQSSALLAMSCTGFRGVPKVNVAIFADTQCEPPWVYEQYERMEQFARKYGVQMIKASAGNLAAHVLDRISGRTTSNGAQIPVFVATEDGDGAMPLKRGCTKVFKLDVIEELVRELLRRKKGQRQKTGPTALALIGISYDERSRVKDARKEWLTNSYPLVDMMITRQGCVDYLASLGIAAPEKSACLFCPFHDDAYWQWLRDNHRKEWLKAVEYDELFRDMSKAGLRNPAYLHRSLVPLAQIELKPRTKAEHRTLFDPYGFENECDGMCGV
jgi:hypothetical protein